MSFRTVTLPPEVPHSRLSSCHSATPSRRSLRLSLSDELPDDLLFDAFESSEEDFPIDAQHPSDPEEGGAVGGEGISGEQEGRLPSIRRVGSRQMLVFLTDGNTIGESWSMAEVARHGVWERGVRYVDGTVVCSAV